jgi:microcystin-dependent protein
MALYDVLGNLIAGGTLFADAPVGVINPFGGTTAPEGWLLCNGQAISRTDYADLFDVIGTAFGSGDGSTTFNVPDMRGKVPVGFNSSETEFDNLGETGGEKTHTLQISEIPSHNHSYSYMTTGATPTYGRCTFTGAGEGYNFSGTTKNTENKGGGESHNNLQPYNTVNFIIKAKHVSLPADFLAEIQEILDSKNILTYGSD